MFKINDPMTWLLSFYSATTTGTASTVRIKAHFAGGFMENKQLKEPRITHRVILVVRHQRLSKQEVAIMGQ